MFYVGYLDLTTCRSIGFGEGPIPWTAIEKYCEVKGIVDEQKEDMFYHVQQLDSVYLKHRAKAAEKT